MINFKPGCTINYNRACGMALAVGTAAQRTRLTAARGCVGVCSSALPTPAVPVCPVAPCPQGIGPMRATRAGAKVRSAAHPTPPVPVRCGVPAAVHVSKYTLSILVLSSVIRHTVIRRKFLCALSDRCRLAYNVSTQTRAPKPDYCTRRSMRAIGHTVCGACYTPTRARRAHTSDLIQLSDS